MNLADAIKPRNLRLHRDAESREFWIDIAMVAYLLKIMPELNKRLVYNYDLLGSLSNWKLNNKSVTCEDIKGNRVRFVFTSKYKFFVNAFDVEEVN